MVGIYASAAFVVAAGLAQVAGAGVTYSNLGPGGRHDHSYRYGSDFHPLGRNAETAWRFTASESGVLTSAKLGLYRTAGRPPNTPVTLTVYADDGTAPGAVIGSWTFTPPAYNYTPTAWQLPLSEGPYLRAGGTYYIAAHAPALITGWEWYVAVRDATNQFPTTRMGERLGPDSAWDMYDPSTMPGVGVLPAFELHVDPCGTSDFNGDGDSGTDADIEAFFACLGGDCCATCFPGGADFNGDGDTGTDADIEAFFRVLAGGNC